ncbi:ATP-binding protein [Vagococcus lutrae]|uniref:ATP-binding protein n=1 Tax=Vagococcus lutrae TaxID=81947 RepID=UPI00201046A1|nr:ATP-binding protein [Vagococcus lutrae]MDT2823275.1 ATP-binding protein [Vagococcus lutrae]MDT2825371.1 ATP-binding protein [Vagococcus lutrae]UQF12317.1 ATP-binding protein [Vagococcus lutrae]UQF18980.1 ATP-binding protein [Vagococcus lutrae]
MKNITIEIKNMKYLDMINMNNRLHELIKEHKGNLAFSFNFNKLKWIDPAGAVVFLETVKNLEEERIELKYIDLDYTSSVIDYGLNIGVFQELGISSNGSKEEGFTYLSPKKVYRNEVFEYIEHYDYSIERYFDIVTEKITNKVIGQSKMTNDNITNLFSYVIRELIRNIFDHSKAEYFYYGSQYLPNRKIVELVISDRGVGLKETIPFDVEEKWLELDTAKNAIQKAFTPGITAASNHSYAPEDYWNSGFGLAMVKSLILAADGSLSLATSDKAITYNQTEEWYDCYIKGTILRFRVDLNKLNLVDFDKQLDSVIQQAQLLNENFIPSKKSQTL